MKKVKLMKGNNLDLLKKLPDNSIDSIVSDPPYGLSFMNKKWDYDVPSVEFWQEIYRVLKPGGHILSFGGTRTYHRMVVNIEDAGFEIRDQIMWLYGSGFPKSHNIGKAIDATIKTGKSNPKSINESEMTKTDGEVVEVLQPNNGILGDKKMVIKTVGASLETKEAQKWQGYGTALKPANEPICVARKPLSEKSVAENVLKWGTGGINIDGCRIGTEHIQSLLVKPEKNTHHNYTGTDESNALYDENGNRLKGEINEGRFPANIILDETAAQMLDEQSGFSKTNHKGNRNDKGVITGVIGFGRGTEVARQDSGGASRFFYIPKVSKKERNMGLDGFEEKTIHDEKNKYGIERFNTLPKKNSHPTLKPVKLMAYLCRLITPKNGIVLDPFMGSGSTGIAALLEGFRFCGMELDENYFKIAESRIENYELYKEFLDKKTK